LYTRKRPYCKTFSVDNVVVGADDDDGGDDDDDDAVCDVIL